MYIHRDLEEILKKYLHTKEIIAVVGARQCGKTTLLKHIFKNLKNALFLDFEERDKLELFESDIEAFIRLYVKNYNYLFIDEFQYAKEGGKKLKYIYDSHKIKILLSGSSSSELSIESIRFLVGRIFIFQLNPLSFKEYVSFINPDLAKELEVNQDHSRPITERINKYLNEFLIYGGYPRVATAKFEEEKEIVLKNIFDTYFLKEIKAIFGLSSDFQLSKLITALALQTGSIVNYNELSTLTGLKYSELLKHLHILLKTFITLECKPFYTNKRTELVRAPKIYFLDNGFQNTVLKNFRNMKYRTDTGSLRENFIASEFVKKNFELRYWRTKSKAEVDFIWQKEGQNIPVEIKSKLSTAQMSRSFRSYLDKYNPEQGFIASEDLFFKQKTNLSTIYWIPLYKFPMFIA